jgi:hypothetical protein
MRKPHQLWVLTLCVVLSIAGVWVGGYAQTRGPMCNMFQPRERCGRDAAADQCDEG